MDDIEGAAPGIDYRPARSWSGDREPTRHSLAAGLVVEAVVVA